MLFLHLKHVVGMALVRHHHLVSVSVGGRTAHVVGGEAVGVCRSVVLRLVWMM